MAVQVRLHVVILLLMAAVGWMSCDIQQQEKKKVAKGWVIEGDTLLSYYKTEEEFNFLSQKS